MRIGAGLEATGRLRPESLERALETVELYAHFCRAMGIDDVRPLATSAIREAANRDDFVRAARERAGLTVEVLPWASEARLGYVAGVNSTTLENGVVLDLGGGSLQLVDVGQRRALVAGSWRLGAVRMTERFLPAQRARAKQLAALRAHVSEELASAPWLRPRPGPDRRLTGLGGAVRNLAAAAQLAAGLPSYGVQGFLLTRAGLGELVERLAGLPASRRGTVPGIKPDRGDLILAAAVVLETVLEQGGFEALEATEAGMREGAFFTALLAGTDPPLVPGVRRASVLWAASMLHDIGMSVGYDDHHRHSRYLILGAGLPGFSQRETALVAQAVRYHRKGTPSLGEFAPLAERGDEELLDRTAALLRVAEQLERARDQSVSAVDVAVGDGAVELRLASGGDVTVAEWSAQRQGGVFERAFGRSLRVSGP